MKTKRARPYRSEAFAAIHETAEALHRVGAIDKITMQEFDETCLEVVEEIKPGKIRALSKRVQKSGVGLGTRQTKAGRPRASAFERH